MNTQVKIAEQTTLAAAPLAEEVADDAARARATSLQADDDARIEDWVEEGGAFRV